MANPNEPLRSLVRPDVPAEVLHSATSLLLKSVKLHLQGHLDVKTIRAMVVMFSCLAEGLEFGGHKLVGGDPASYAYCRTLEKRLKEVVRKHMSRGDESSLTE